MVSILGRPNVGKSTLLNALVGEKVAIVAPKPQTTRTRICGVYNYSGTQIVFVDTPGFHKPRNALGEFMTGIVNNAASGVDCVLLIVPPEPTVGTQERLLIERTKNQPCVLVINKSDTVHDKKDLLPVIAAYQNEREFEAVVPISAEKRDGLDVLLDVIMPFIPEGEPLFPPDMTSDQSDETFVSELIREKLLRLLDREVPHGAAVMVERFGRREDGLLECEATILCEKRSHKGIIIGKNGECLGRIGKSARLELERLYGEKLFLNLWVKVKENWRDNAGILRGLGYTDR